MSKIISLDQARASGLAHYFTGIMCVRGHIAKRHVSSRCCVECGKETSRVYCRDNLDKVRENKRKYRAKNRERVREKGREASRRYREAHPARIKESKRRCRAGKPETQRALTRCRRRAKQGAEGKYTAKDIIRIGDSQSWRCAYCRIRIKKNYEIDHIVAVINGGSNWPSNLQLLCSHCNRSKGCREAEEFVREKFGKLL